MENNLDYKKVLMGFNEDLWADISGEKLPLNFILEFKNKIEWEAFDYNRNSKSLTLDSVELLKDYISWDEYSYYIKDQDILDKYSDLVNWDKYSTVIDHTLLDKYKNKINWEVYSDYYSSSFEEYLKYKAYINEENFMNLSFNDIKLENVVKYYNLLNIKKSIVINFKGYNEVEALNLVKELTELCKQEKINLCLDKSAINSLTQFSEEFINSLLSPNIINSIKINYKFNSNDIPTSENFLNVLISILKINISFIFKDHILLNFAINNINHLDIQEQLLRTLINHINSNSNTSIPVKIDYSVLKKLKSLILNENFNILKYPDFFILNEEDIEDWIIILNEIDALYNVFFIKEYYPNLSEGFIEKYKEFIDC